MSVDDREPATEARSIKRAALVLTVAVAAPLGLLVALRTWPVLDVLWHNNPAHFWLVLAAAAIATGLGHHVAAAARRRYDARLFLLSLAFIASAGFLALHALATPGVLVGPNPGFELATPVGLMIGSVFAAASAIEFTRDGSQTIMRNSRAMLAALFALMLVWAVASLAELPPLDRPIAEDGLPAWQLAVVGVGSIGYGIGGWGYWRLYRRRQAPIVLTFAVAYALLAVSLIVVAFSISWRVSWWEWHVLMLVAFGIMAYAARQEWHEERFSALYLQKTLASTTEASILFADLASFTSYSERVGPAAVRHMLDTYLAALIPLMRAHGGDIHQLSGDAIMVVFNRHGTQPDHARLAAGAALAVQKAADDIAADNPDWPRFRVGVNSGEVIAGVVGDEGHRKLDVIGDTVNLAARLESHAPIGGVLIGEGTRERLPGDANVEQLGPIQVKGKAAPVRAFLLHDLPE